MMHAGAAPRSAQSGSCALQLISDDADVLGFLALSARCHVELDVLALVEALVALALNVGVMNEDVITLLARDEAESLLCIEELHCSLCHKCSFLKTTDQPVRSARYKQQYRSILDWPRLHVFSTSGPSSDPLQGR